MSGAAGAAIVGIAALIAGWKIKEKDEKIRLKKAYNAGYAAGAQEKQNELQPKITSLQNRNTQLENTVASKEQENTTLKAEIEKLKSKDDKKSDEKKK
jgi:predicted RNase H-like nuclease (RuvC/YqgF family)